MRANWCLVANASKHPLAIIIIIIIIIILV